MSAAAAAGRSRARSARAPGPVRLAIATAAALCLASAPALGQTGGGYDLTWSTIDSGGVTFATGGVYQVGATAGQPDAGAHTGGTFTLGGGFWFALAADLAITKTDGVTTATPGGSVTYTIVASNPGPSSVTGASVADTFPATLACTWTCVGAAGGTCAAAGAGNIGDTVDLPAGGSVTYTASCSISGSATGTLSNTATVSAPAGVTDPNPGNNSATDSDTLVPAPVISAMKTVSGTYVVGSFVVYTVTLLNSGPGAQFDNPGDEFTDILPPALALVSATASSGTALATVLTNTVTWNGSIPPSSSATITITAMIKPAVPGTTVSNQGTARFDADGNLTNESAVQTDDPGQPGSADPTAFSVQEGSVSIPMLGPWALVGLAASLALVGLLSLRRRRARLNFG